MHVPVIPARRTASKRTAPATDRSQGLEFQSLLSPSWLSIDIVRASTPQAHIIITGEQVLTHANSLFVTQSSVRREAQTNGVVQWSRTVHLCVAGRVATVQVRVFTWAFRPWSFPKVHDTTTLHGDLTRTRGPARLLEAIVACTCDASLARLAPSGKRSTKRSNQRETVPAWRSQKSLSFSMHSHVPSFRPQGRPPALPTSPWKSWSLRGISHSTMMKEVPDASVRH